jgi:hypothetical protein
MITENFPNLKEGLSIQIQEASRIPNRLDQNKNSQLNSPVKATSTENREEY